MHYIVTIMCIIIPYKVHCSIYYIALILQKHDKMSYTHLQIDNLLKKEPCILWYHLIINIIHVNLDIVQNQQHNKSFLPLHPLLDEKDSQSLFLPLPSSVLRSDS